VKRRRFLGVAAVAAVVGTPIESPAQERNMQTSLPIEGRLPPFDGAITWLNSPPLTPAGLRGKVVLVDFLTYTCINWQRTQPYIRAWAARYKDHGLVAIGVHTPEFEFEKNLDNIRPGLAMFRVDYPVAVDSDYAIWNAFDNHYWPAAYIADAQGNIRHHTFGEGQYDQQEAVIQQLLREAGYPGTGNAAVVVDPRGSEIAADWENLESPETYLGTGQARGFVSPGGAAVGKSRSYAAPTSLRRNEWALTGDWTVSPGSATSDKGNARIVFRFHARDVNLVMGPASRNSQVRFRVLVDGQPPAAAHGGDVDEQGNGSLTQQRMYQLVRQRRPIRDRSFEIEFLDAGAEAFVFTFG
jgi:hypothetical protein